MRSLADGLSIFLHGCGSQSKPKERTDDPVTGEKKQEIGEFDDAGLLVQVLSRWTINYGAFVVEFWCLKVGIPLDGEFCVGG